MKQSCRHMSFKHVWQFGQCQCQCPLGTTVGRFKAAASQWFQLSSVKRNLAIELMQATESSAPAPWHPRLLRVVSRWAGSKSLCMGEHAKNRSTVISFHITLMWYRKRHCWDVQAAYVRRARSKTYSINYSYTCAHAKERPLASGSV